MIVTSYWRKPIPTPNYDWEAWVDGREECEVGRGRTEADAPHGPSVATDGRIAGGRCAIGY